MSLHLAATYLGLAAIWLFALLVIVLHFLPNECNPLRDGIGGYRAGKLRVPATVALLLLGVGAGFIDIAGVWSIGAGKRVAVGVLFIGLFAVGQILRAFLACDADSSERTPLGRAHTWVSVVAYGSMLVGVIAATPTLDRVQHWKAIFPVMSWIELGVVVFALLLLVTRIKALRVVFGLVDRLFYVSAVAWLSVLALHFVRIPR